MNPSNAGFAIGPKGLAPEQPSRPQRLGAIIEAQISNNEFLFSVLQKVEGIRARALGEGPTETPKAEQRLSRTGCIGAIEDKTDDTRLIIARLNEVVNELNAI